jgi:hypothetical protein
MSKRDTCFHREVCALRFCPCGDYLDEELVTIGISSEQRIEATERLDEMGSELLAMRNQLQDAPDLEVYRQIMSYRAERRDE